MLMPMPSRVLYVLVPTVLLLSLGAGRGMAGPSFDVTFAGADLGTFAVDVYQGEVTDTPQGVLYGAAIQGVFTPSSTAGLPAGYQYRWIQTVNSSDPIYDVDANWQVPGETYVDRTRQSDGKTVVDESPFYATRFDPGTGTLPFQDNPARLAETFDGTWTLTLVAVEAPSDPLAPFDVANPSDDREIVALTSFVWGYTYELGAASVVLKDLVQQAVDLDALTAAFDRDIAYGDPFAFSSSAWTLRSDFAPVTVPEPGSLALAALPIALLVAARRAARRSAMAG